MNDKNLCNVTFREQTAADIFVEASGSVISEFADPDFDQLAARSVAASDALMAALEIEDDVEGEL